MNLGIPAGELALLLGALLAAGFLTGLLAGLLGIGGGGILVPVLYELFGSLGVDDAIRMHLAVGTSLAVIILTSLRSFSAHRARGAVDMEIVKSMALPVIAGVCLGAALARYSNDAVLKAIWVVAATLMGIRLYFGRRGWQFGDEIPGHPFRMLYGGFVGLVSTLMSIGGGVFVTTMMTLYGRPIQNAVATSSGFGPLIAIPGALGLRLGRLAGRRSAAGLARLCQPARRAPDHPDQRAGGTARRAHRPRHLAAQARAGVRDLPHGGVAAFPAQPVATRRGPAPARSWPRSGTRHRRIAASWSRGESCSPQTPRNGRGCGASGRCRAASATTDHGSARW
jgi:uncharacterized protein